jgi:hypothetical protein
MATRIGSELTYILAQEGNGHGLSVEASAGQVRVLVPIDMASMWAGSDQVGLDGAADPGARGALSVLVEKDFACIDRTDEENADTFPNPLGVACLSTVRGTLLAREMGPFRRIVAVDEAELFCGFKLKGLNKAAFHRLRHELLHGVPSCCKHLFGKGK